MFYDDILNVNAYLREKIRKNMNDTAQLAADYEMLDQDFDQMLDQADDLLAQVQALAENLGVELPASEPAAAVPEVEDCAQLLVSIPDDYDFSAAFAQLVEEAHGAGFNNVRPGDLLSKEEMHRAEAFQEALDERFRKETGLTVRDMVILVTATAVRILCYYCFEYLFSGKNPELAAEPTLYQNQEGAVPVPEISATQGVDMNAVLNGGQSVAGMNSLGGTSAADLLNLSRRANTIMGTAGLRSQHQILQEQVPFDVADNDYFGHGDILGFHPIAGWLVGVINILTNTVTTKKLESYSVSPGFDAPGNQVDRKLSTAVHVVFPVIRDVAGSKESLLAAVVREADALGVTKAPIQDVSRNLQQVMAAEEEKMSLLNQAQDVAAAFSKDLTGILKHTAVTAFLNQLIAAMHAVNYNPQRDGDMELYTIRTHKILTMSNAMATLVNSIPAILAQDISGLDGAGILTTCLSLFSSTRFWIEVKTNYLVSAYKQEADKAMAQLDRYFQK